MQASGQDTPDQNDVSRLRQARCVLIFGGSFDPPHRGHLELPRQAMQAVGADLIAYIPAASQPLKQGNAVTPAEHRVAMLRLALRDADPDRAATVVLLDEIERAAEQPDRPSYMVDTLEALRAKLSVAGDAGPTLRLLIGEDNLRVFDRWRQPERIIELAEPLVLLRHGNGNARADSLDRSRVGDGSGRSDTGNTGEQASLDDAALREALLPSLPGGYDIDDWLPRVVALPYVDISSTEVRRRIGAGEAVGDLLPPSVMRYIHEHGLYGAA